MIKVEKGNEPDFLHSEKVDLAFEKLEEFFSSKNRNQKRYDWPFNKEIDKELKSYLHESFYGKCGYCESAIENSETGYVDRYRPNNGVRDKKEYFQDLYWWLTFEWDNFVYCCKECNSYKANYFPIKGRRALNEQDDLAQEHRMLLNPYIDDPNVHFTYDNDGNIVPLTDEGFQTIELLRLDRTNLVTNRTRVRKEIIGFTEDVLANGIQGVSTATLRYLKDIYELENFNTEFLAFKKWVLLNELDSTPFLGQILKFEDYKQDENWIEKVEPPIINISKKDVIVNDYFPIEYIHIKNFKSISDLKIEFKEDENNKKAWLFLLGENGVGKSSILQAIAIGLKADKKLLEPLIHRLIAKKKTFSEIVIKERNSDNVIVTTLNRKEKSISQIGIFNSYLVGYGSLRLSVDESESQSLKDISTVSYNNLFHPTKSLNDISKWLKSIFKNDKDFFDRIAYSLKLLLPHDYTETLISFKGNSLVLGESEKLFFELSDGYQSTITLAVDIMMKLSNAQSDMDKMTGIVLIDELGNQLHPRWQMRIVKQLRQVFPNINFIISTHHPLCLRGAENGEILLLRNIDSSVVATTELPNPSTLRVDQILTSEFFGLNSLVDPEIEARFNRYYELLSKNDNISQDEKKELYELKDELRNKQQLGNSLREELMYSVIDKLLAERVNFNKNLVNRTSLKEEAVQRVKEVWKNLNLENDD